jgi:hypothetical protein
MIPSTQSRQALNTQASREGGLSSTRVTCALGLSAGVWVRSETLLRKYLPFSEAEGEKKGSTLPGAVMTLYDRAQQR